MQQLRVATKASLPGSWRGNQKLCIRTAQLVRGSARGVLDCFCSPGTIVVSMLSRRLNWLYTTPLCCKGGACTHCAAAAC